MATTNLKRIASKTFATWLEGKVPELVGKIHTVAEGPTEAAGWPCVALVPNILTFEPFHSSPVVWAAAVDDGKALLNVGEFTGSYELRIYAKNVSEREALEDKVLHAIMAEPMRRGVVSLQTPALTVNALVTLYQAPVAFMLDQIEWNEEFAYENRRFSFIDLDVEFPALVVQDVYTINQLVIAINENLSSDVPDEQFSIDEDGITTEI
jgi:hypothetical protein